MPNTCNDCRYFVRPEVVEDVGDDDTFGLCHGLPPTPIYIGRHDEQPYPGVEGVRPNVEAGDVACSLYAAPDTDRPRRRFRVVN